MMAVTDAHELYAWGSGTFGEGGYGEVRFLIIFQVC
jgi:hypothetical protein